MKIQRPEGTIADAMTGAAVERLHAYYLTAWNESLRWVLQVAHTAMTEAVAAGAEVIDETHVDAAAAGYDQS